MTSDQETRAIELLEDIKGTVDGPDEKVTEPYAKVSSLLTRIDRIEARLSNHADHLGRIDIEIAALKQGFTGT